APVDLVIGLERVEQVRHADPVLRGGVDPSPLAELFDPPAQQPFRVALTLAAARLFATCAVDAIADPPAPPAEHERPEAGHMNPGGGRRAHGYLPPFRARTRRRPSTSGDR